MDAHEEQPDPGTLPTPPPTETPAPAPEPLRAQSGSGAKHCADLGITEAFYCSETDLLIRIAHKKGVPPSLCEKVAQETWLDAVKHAEQFQGADAEEKLRAFLQRIAHSKTADVLRYLHRHPVKSLDDLPSALVDRKAAARAEAEEEREWLGSLLQKLQREIGERDCWLLCQRIQEGRTAKDLAMETGLTVSAVYNRIRRARQELRRLALRSLYGDDAEP